MSDEIKLQKKTEEIVDAKVNQEVSTEPSVLAEAKKLKADIEEATKKYQEERDKFEKLAAEFELGGKAMAGARKKSQDELDQEQADKFLMQFFGGRK